MKFKECEKRDKYLDLARELKKLWIIPIVIGALGTVTKGLEQGLESLMFPHEHFQNMKQSSKYL